MYQVTGPIRIILELSKLGLFVLQISADGQLKSASHDVKVKQQWAKYIKL